MCPGVLNHGAQLLHREEFPFPSVCSCTKQTQTWQLAPSAFGSEVPQLTFSHAGCFHGKQSMDRMAQEMLGSGSSLSLD